MQIDVSLPFHVPEQIALYQGDQLLSHEVCRFHPIRAVQHLQPRRDVLAIDIGGDKARSAIYRFEHGNVSTRDERVLQAKGGRGYLEFLRELAEEANARDLAVGISSATKLNGSAIERTVNLPVFLHEMREHCGADYRNLFGERASVVNDTIAGICGASTHLALDGVAVGDVAFFISGSGMGASVISQGTALHVEAAHVPVVAELNPFGQRTPCGVEGREYTCLDRIVAGRTGIEDIYRQQTGTSLDGVALGKLYEAGDPLATSLYETSALALAHAIAGVMQRYHFRDSESSAVVLHGGNFEVAAYRDAVRRRLDALPHPRCRIVFSRDLSRNVCLDGAAVLAAWHEADC